MGRNRSNPNSPLLAGTIANVVDLDALGLVAKWDVSGPLSARRNYNNEQREFAYLATDTVPFMLYIKNNTTGTDKDWSIGLPVGPVNVDKINAFLQYIQILGTDTDAANILFTALGMPQALANKINRTADDIDPVIKSREEKYNRFSRRAYDFGAIADGATDSSSALRNASLGVASNYLGSTGYGGKLILDGYLPYVIATTVAQGSDQIWQGSHGQGLISKVVNGPAIISGGSGGIDNLVISYGGATPTGGQSPVGLQMGGTELGQNSRCANSAFRGFDICIDKRANVVGKISNTTCDDWTTAGVRIRDLTRAAGAAGAGDAGDWTLNGVTCTGRGTTGAGIKWESSGGLKVTNYKGLSGAYGIDARIAEGYGTVDLQIANSSIENQAVAGVRLGRLTTGGSAIFGQVTIVGTEFGGQPIGVWMHEGVGSVVVASCNFLINSDVPIKVDPGATNVVVGLSTYTANALVQDNRVNHLEDLGYLDRRDQSPLTLASSADWITAYSIIMTPYRGLEVKVTVEGILQGLGANCRTETFLLVCDNTLDAANGNTAKLYFKSRSSTEITTAASYASILEFRVVGSSTVNKFNIQFRKAQNTGSGLFQGTVSIDVDGKATRVQRGG